MAFAEVLCGTIELRFEHGTLGGLLLWLWEVRNNPDLRAFKVTSGVDCVETRETHRIERKYLSRKPE